MRDEKLSVRAKVTHKMTKDGLVARNETTGEERRISQRGQDFALRQTPPDRQSFSSRDAPSKDSRRRKVPRRMPGLEQSSPANQSGMVRASDVPIRPAEPVLPDRSGSSAPATETGPEIPHAATEPSAAGSTSYHEPASYRSDTPPPPRTQADAPHSGGERRFADIPRSRLRFDSSEQTTDRVAAGVQHDSKYARKLTPDANKAPPPPSEHPSDSAAHSEAASEKQSTPKLQFAADETPPEPLGRKLTQAKRKAERANQNLEKAREKLPTRRRVRMIRESDPETGKTHRRLRIENEDGGRLPVKTRRQHVKGPLPLRPVKAAGNAVLRYGHRKMFEVEDENVGAKAAHRTEMAAEGLARAAYRIHKTRPYSRVSRLQQKSVKANANLAYRQALHDNPKLQSNAISRMVQKQRIKRQYAKAAREAKRTGTTIKQTGSVVAKTFRAMTGFVSRHPAAAGAIALMLLLLFVIMAMFSSCGAMVSGGFQAILMSSYTASDSDIDAAELAYREWETELQLQMDNAETDYPGYDEYRFQVGDIGHNPYELMAYLTAKYHDFTFADVEADLRVIFAEQYNLTFVEEVEIRYNDPDDANEDGDLEPYDYRILHITMISRSFTDVIASRLDEDQREHSDLLMDSGGNRQYAGSPFPFDWRPYISCYYGWRVHPITGAVDNHPAVDIAVAAGTQILAAHDGTVTISTWHDAYGYYIALDDGDGLVTKYAHCSQLLVSAGREVKQGDVIALVGSTGNSTGSHLHYEVIKESVYLNPLYFALTD